MVRTLTERISGYEVLARWDDPKYGFLTPDVFIPVLEKSHNVYLLDLEILRQICIGYKNRTTRNAELVPVSFNLSRVDFEVKDIHERINAITDKYDVPHNMIHIEITESSFFEGTESLEDHIQWFRRDGYEIWMDDFGSGYSTFNTLQIHSFDFIKLDMMFLRHFNEKAEEIIKSIITLAKKLGIGTVCEGVENAEQVEFLKKVGCERMQGWYYGRPIPLLDFDHLNIERTNRLEIVEEQSYWNAISRINLLSSDAELILEYKENTGKVLATNEAMYRVMDKIHPEGSKKHLNVLCSKGMRCLIL